MFARKPIRAGRLIIEYTGKRITPDEADRRADEEATGRHHTFYFSVSGRVVIDGGQGGNEARFINHSCDPNCEAVEEDGRIFVYAKEDIPEGVELSYDYRYATDSSYSARELRRRYPCRCGSEACRGTIALLDEPALLNGKEKTMAPPRKRRARAKTARSE